MPRPPFHPPFDSVNNSLPFPPCNIFFYCPRRTGISPKGPITLLFSAPIPASPSCYGGNLLTTSLSPDRTISARAATQYPLPVEIPHGGHCGFLKFRSSFSLSHSQEVHRVVPGKPLDLRAPHVRENTVSRYGSGLSNHLQPRTAQVFS